MAHKHPPNVNVVITVARKPLSEGTLAKNALKHGTGGINVDGCRITTAAWDAKAMERVNSVGSGRNYGQTARQTPDGRWDGPIGTGVMDTTQGRWPANLILQHLPGCQLTATVDVPAPPPTPSGMDRINHNMMMQGARPNAYQKGTPPPPQDTRNPDGTETVAVWDCQPGCPVAHLDRQSGIVATGTWNRQTDTAHPFGNAKDTPYQNWKPAPIEAPAGASRYFKQVQPRPTTGEI